MFVNKKVFTFFLNELVLRRERTLLGSWFHALGAATRNARSPNRSIKVIYCTVVVCFAKWQMITDFQTYLNLRFCSVFLITSPLKIPL